ncbi:MAG: IS200/IS605 family element transposase accessory protein TnpB [Moorea sp. SIO2B7]|nr:IS200/IS605 family element transposase accessory protein TnpB [Moorena sp. SIO2B7]
MQLVERHLIKKTHQYWSECDSLSFKAKNLYNLCNYYMRQSFFERVKALSNTELYHKFSSLDAYKQMLTTKIACSLIRQVCQSWKGDFQAHKDWKINPSKYLGEPRIPSYKHKLKGRYRLIHKGGEAIYKKSLKEGIYHLSQSQIKIKINRAIHPVLARIVPRQGCCVIEIVYEVEKTKIETNAGIAVIDLGINKPTVSPLLINGQPLKSINQQYNKVRGSIQSRMGEYPSRIRLECIILKRNNKVSNYLHKTYFILVNYLKANQIKTLVVGNNDGGKQQINIGRRNNQNFVQITHARLLEMLQDKSQLAGIKLVTVNQAYTSKCSALDLEPICKHEKYVGKRIKRSLFKTGTGIVINADLNGSLNIIRMYSPKAFIEGIESCGVQPLNKG